MPLRFRAVIPYTLPGVLALIGWWWYISRKKERLISHDTPEGSASTTGLRTSPAEGSNGLVETTTVSPTTDTESSTQIHPKVTDQRTESVKIAQDTEALPSLEPSPAENVHHFGSLRQETAHEATVPTLPSPDKDDSLQVAPQDSTDLEESSAPVLVKELEQDLVKDPATVEDVLLHCQSTKVSHTAAHLSDAERPEPEGEVAKQNNVINAEDELIVCQVTPAKVQSATPSDSDSLKMPPTAQDFQHVLTSTPTLPGLASTALIRAHESSTTSVTPDDIQVHRVSVEEQDLELLASGLISEVISAATQEVLGVTSCHMTDSSQTSCCSTASLDSGRPLFQLEPVTAAKQQHHLLSDCESGHAVETKEQGVPNGCSLDSPNSHQANSAQRGHRPTPSHQAASSAPLPDANAKGDEAALPTEDSACSTCHSEDGASSEDLQNVIQARDYSAREATQPLVQAGTEENSVDTDCEIKKLNGVGLRNGAHGACEVDNDQSGGSDVNSMDSVDSGCTMGVGESQSNHVASSSSELSIWEIEVPKHLVGRLIGKQGRYVSYLKQNSGAKIYISTLPYTQEFQICHIEGTQQQVDKALALIGKKFKDLDLTNLYAPPPPPLTLPSLPMTSWLLLPSGVTVEVIVVNIVSAGHVFVQQHTHPTYHALRSLDQQMFLCYSQPGTPALPSPAEVGVICAAPAVEGAWWRAQVITFYKETNEVEIRYVDYGGYDRVKIDSLRQIRSDFVTLPFQGAEVLLDNIAPLPGEDRFSAEATSALEEMTRGVALLAQVSNYDNNTGLPLVHLWNMVGDEIISVNRTLAERGLGVWVDGF